MLLLIRVQLLTLAFWPTAVDVPPSVPAAVRRRLSRGPIPPAAPGATVVSSADHVVTRDASLSGRKAQFYLEVAVDARRSLVVTSHPPLASSPRVLHQLLPEVSDASLTVPKYRLQLISWLQTNLDQFATLRLRQLYRLLSSLDESPHICTTGCVCSFVVDLMFESWRQVGTP